MARKIIKRKTNAAKVTKPTSRAAVYIVTARFPNGRTIPIQAVGATGRDKAISLIKKQAPSAKITIKKG